MRRFRLAALVVTPVLALATALGAAPSAAATPTPAATWGWWQPAPNEYLLSLGDSLGFGYSDAKLAQWIAAGSKPADAPAIFTGYTKALAQHLDVPATNLSCPGATSTSMQSGDCSPGDGFSWTYPGGSQLAGAQAFLSGLRSKRGVITLSIGADDALALVDDPNSPCLSNPLCPELKPMLKTLQSNLKSILRTLRSAAPKATIVVLTPYNPFGHAQPISNVAAVALNATIGLTAVLNGARVADAFGPINVDHANDFDCGNLVYYCADNPPPASDLFPRDVHPTDAGYAAIEKAFERVIG